MKKNNPLYSVDSIQEILQLSSVFEQSKILLSACELNFFSIIENNHKTAKEIAVEAGTNEKATERILNALTAMNLLTKDGSTYSNTKGTRRFLVDSRPEYIGDMHFLNNQWEKWGDLTNAIRTGNAISYQDIKDKDAEWVKSYVDSIYWRGSLKAPDIISELNLHDVDSILDLGCGSALYAIELKKAKPSLKVSALDFPNVLKVATNHIDREGFLGQIELIPCDMYNDPIPGKYDAVFISNVLKYFSFWENVNFMHKLYEILNPGGKIFIQETLVSDDKTTPPSAAIDSVALLVNTQSGDVFTESDLWMILKEGWFNYESMKTTPFGSSLIIGRK